MVTERTVIVTGASRGIGAAVAVWLGCVGGRVGLVARSAMELEQVAMSVEKHGGKALILETDVADADACARAVETTLTQFGRLDGLVNNAGMLEPVAGVVEAEPGLWRRNIEVNLLAPFYFTHAAIAALREQKGRIVNIGTGASQKAMPTWSAYCASKAGLTHFTRVVAVEEPHITTITLRPGVVDTHMQTLIRESGSTMIPPEMVAYFQELKAKNRLEDPRVPARAIAWLVLHAPLSLSGAFVDYTDPEISDPALALFGKEPHSITKV